MLISMSLRKETADRRVTVIPMCPDAHGAGPAARERPQFWAHPAGTWQRQGTVERL